MDCRRGMPPGPWSRISGSAGLFKNELAKPLFFQRRKARRMKTAASDLTLRHLLDLCRRSEKTGSWQYSAFLTPAEQEDLMTDPEGARFSFQLTGGYENAERKLMAAGSEEESGPPAPPVSVVLVRPKSEKFSEDLSHRDFLGAILGLGFDRSVLGDLIIRDSKAWVFCLSSVAELLVSSLTQVRRTPVLAEEVSPDVPELQPRYQELRLNVASERLDAVVAAFAGLSRSQADRLFASEKVLVGGRTVTDRSFRLREGDVISVRGFGKAVYDGIEYETRKSRYRILLRKLV